MTNHSPLRPRVRHHFFVCTNQRPTGHPLPSCARRGGLAVYEAFLDEMAGRGYPEGVKVTSAGCLTPCQCGPNVLVYPAGVWYAEVTPSDVPEIVGAHVDRGEAVERLRLPEEMRV